MMGRLRSLTHNFYTNILKPSGPALTFGHSQILAFPSALARQPFSVRIFAKFENDEFDHLHIITGLSRSDRFAPAALNKIRVDLISNSPQWTEALLGDFETNLEQSKFTYEIPTSSLPGFDADGELTLKITSECERLGKRYKSAVYVNHLGIYPSFIFLKSAVEYLEISKVDE